MSYFQVKLQREALLENAYVIVEAGDMDEACHKAMRLDEVEDDLEFDGTIDPGEFYVDGVCPASGPDDFSSDPDTEQVPWDCARYTDAVRETLVMVLGLLDSCAPAPAIDAMRDRASKLGIEWRIPNDLPPQA